MGCDYAQRQPCSPHPTAAKDTNQGADVLDWVIPQSERVKMITLTDFDSWRAEYRHMRTYVINPSI